MVGISFMWALPLHLRRRLPCKARGKPNPNGYCREKLMKLDAKRREYDIIVIGEEPHLAYNRVGLTSFFQHRKVENLYLNPKEWVRLSSCYQMGNWIWLFAVLELSTRIIKLPYQHHSPRNPPWT
jgi:hypothetical protein